MGVVLGGYIKFVVFFGFVSLVCNMLGRLLLFLSFFFACDGGGEGAFGISLFLFLGRWIVRLKVFGFGCWDLGVGGFFGLIDASIAVYRRVIVYEKSKVRRFVVFSSGLVVFLLNFSFVRERINLS